MSTMDITVKIRIDDSAVRIIREELLAGEPLAVRMIRDGLRSRLGLDEVLSIVRRSDGYLARAEYLRARDRRREIRRAEGIERVEKTRANRAARAARAAEIMAAQEKKRRDREDRRARTERDRVVQEAARKFRSLFKEY